MARLQADSGPGDDAPALTARGSSKRGEYVSGLVLTGDRGFCRSRCGVAAIRLGRSSAGELLSDNPS